VLYPAESDGGPPKHVRRTAMLSAALFPLLVACTGGTDTMVDSSPDSAADTDTDTDSDTAPDLPPVALVLGETLDTNEVVATKGMDVTADGSVVYLWNYNQDILDRWDGVELT
jgi:hypothetical protein